jgi:hypothetical protein
MAKINMGRVILGGIVAGIVVDLLGSLVDGVMLAPRWADGMKALGHSAFSSNAWIWFNLFGLASGIVLIWLYASIRPRFGAGPRTALYAGLPFGLLECCCRTRASCGPLAFSQQTWRS